MTPADNPRPGPGALPRADTEALAHSAALCDSIARHIDAAGGVIGFDEFMRLALYAPGLGYYSAGTDQFGASGDFVTAPEISPLFGECLARQVEALLTQGCRPRLLEFGAGSGRLCGQLLAALPQIETYSILDVSAGLRQRQQQALRQVLDDRSLARVDWLDRLPNDFDGIVIANEVLDAMPVKRVKKSGGWLELGVGCDDGGFGWRERAVEERLRLAIEGIEAEVGLLPDGYDSELNLNLGAWFNALGDACRRGVALLIDYGFERREYYSPERGRGTLNCHYRHHVHDDPLWQPGLQDITAFVDFDACADAAIAAGFDIHGLVSQRQFLFANGLLDLAGQRQQGASTERQFAIAQQVKTLSLPEEMGRRFQVLAMSRGIEVELPAFAHRGRHG